MEKKNHHVKQRNLETTHQVIAKELWNIDEVIRPMYRKWPSREGDMITSINPSHEVSHSQKYIMVRDHRHGKIRWRETIK
jgi:hypothetical protein